MQTYFQLKFELRNMRLRAKRLEGIFMSAYGLMGGEREGGWMGSLVYVTFFL